MVQKVSHAVMRMQNHRIYSFNAQDLCSIDVQRYALGMPIKKATGEGCSSSENHYRSAEDVIVAKHHSQPEQAIKEPCRQTHKSRDKPPLALQAPPPCCSHNQQMGQQKERGRHLGLELLGVLGVAGIAVEHPLLGPESAADACRKRRAQTGRL